MNESNQPKPRSPKLLHMAAAAAAVILLVIGSITAYMTDLDVRRNVITIGSVKAVLDEGSYTDSQTVVPGQSVPKAPKLTNAGRNDAYLFLKIEVPKAPVTLLYETADATHQPGEIRVPKDANKPQQIFRLIADGEVSESLTDPASSDAAVTFHGKTETGAGWVLLADKCSFTDMQKDVYVFGYSRKLPPGEATVPLFDRVQLKSIIDRELHDADLLTDMEIRVQGYAIQDRNLHITGMEDGAEQPSAAQLSGIYEIVQRKAAQNHG